MSYEKFLKNLSSGLENERLVAEAIIENEGDVQFLDCNNDDRFDLKVYLCRRGLICTIEVKEDIRCKSTGNVAIEVSSYGKASGIMASKAMLFCYVIHEPCGGVNAYFVETRVLKELIIEGNFHKVSAGDGHQSKCYLVPLLEMKKHCALYSSIKAECNAKAEVGEES